MCWLEVRNSLENLILRDICHIHKSSKEEVRIPIPTSISCCPQTNESILFVLYLFQNNYIFAISTLLCKCPFTTVWKEIQSRLTNRSKIRGDCKYPAFNHGHVIVMIDYVARYISQRLSQTTMVKYINLIGLTHNHSMVYNNWHSIYLHRHLNQSWWNTFFLIFYFFIPYMPLFLVLVFYTLYFTITKPTNTYIFVTKLWL